MPLLITIDLSLLKSLSFLYLFFSLNIFQLFPPILIQHLKFFNFIIFMFSKINFMLRHLFVDFLINTVGILDLSFIDVIEILLHLLPFADFRGYLCHLFWIIWRNTCIDLLELMEGMFLLVIAELLGKSSVDLLEGSLNIELIHYIYFIIVTILITINNHLLQVPWQSPFTFLSKGL